MDFSKNVSPGDSTPHRRSALISPTIKERGAENAGLVPLRERLPVCAAAGARPRRRGRLEIGFVKSGDSEMVSGNANPVGYVDRFWEAMDVIKLALTSHDGPVSYEGKHFTHRHINIWPSPYQRPHPRFWAATGDPETSAELGRRGYINALVLRGPEASKRAFDSYRKARQEAGLPAPGSDKFAYAALCYVGDTDEEGLQVGSKLLWFLNTSLKQSPQMSKFLPGRNSPEMAPNIWRVAARQEFRQIGRAHV